MSISCKFIIFLMMCSK